jgi:GNAT superfamily N-acetyltransferase
MTYERPGSPKHRECTLLRGVRIERGTHDDWRSFAPLHYRSHNAGAVTDIFRMVYAESPAARPCEAQRSPAMHHPQSPLLVAVIVYSRSPLTLAARARATGGRYSTAGLGRVAGARLINAELRIISRVVVAPNWRGLGLAGRLVTETMPLVGTPYVESLAAMGEMHPMFTRAGMTAYPLPPSREGERLRAALEARSPQRPGTGRGARPSRPRPARPRGARNRTVGAIVPGRQKPPGQPARPAATSRSRGPPPGFKAGVLPVEERTCII